MARTLHMQLTPSRRSKRLVANGYYSIPSGDGSMNSSEDDDDMSVHSNSSSLYSERSIKYRESPILATRKRRFKKLQGDSPQKRIFEHSSIQSSSRGVQKTKEKLTVSTSSMFPHRAPGKTPPPYSQSSTQLNTANIVFTREDMPSHPNNLSAGDRVDIRTTTTQRVLQSSINLTAEESPSQSVKEQSDIQNFNSQSIVVTLHHFLLSLVRNAVYSFSKIIYLTALRIYSCEVKALAWRVGAVPWKIMKLIFFLLLLLATVHLAAKHVIGDDYVAVTRVSLYRKWARLRFESRMSSTTPHTVTSDLRQDAGFPNKDFESALTKIEVAFAFKLSEMKDDILSLQDDFDETRQRLQKFEDSLGSSDSKISSLHSHLKGQQKVIDTLQDTVRVSQEFATKKELNDRAIALATQQSQMNDLIKNILDKYDGQITNETRVREIVMTQVVERFLGILQITQASDEEAGRVQAMLLSWLNEQGFVTKEELDTDLRSLQGLYATKLERVRQDARRHSSTITLEKIVEPPLVEPQQSGGSDIEAEVKRWIQEALAVYSADRIGLADHALESAGGCIASTRCSESYDKKTALVSILGIPFYYNINTPRSVIQAGNLPGECWSFKGYEGYVVIGLSGSVRPTSFSLEHIPRELSLAGHIDSAPKDFVVLGLADINDEKGIVLGTYRYEQTGPAVQQFTKEADNHEFFKHIELRVRSNWGNPTYTCLYRFRVHGERAGAKNPSL